MHITRDTLWLLFPLTKRQRKALEDVGYCAEDTCSYEAFARALGECPRCAIREPSYDRIREENDVLAAWWVRIDKRIERIEVALRDGAAKVESPEVE